MQLDDLTQNRSISTISKKTNLTVSVIEKLFNKDFASFSYPQAKGAIAIIEREFDINLDILSEECKYYFTQNPPEDKGISVIKPIIEEKTLIPKLITLILLALIAYGAWYFFVEYYNKQILVSTPSTHKSIESTILQKDDTITTTPVHQESKEKPTQTLAVTLDNSTQIQQPKPIEPLVDKAKVVAIIKSPETNSTLVEVAPIVENNQTTELNKSTPKIVPLEFVVPVQPKIIPREKITLLPKENMWFRLINLETKTRKEYKQPTPYSINVRNNSWIFAAQNVNFSFEDKNKTAGYGGRGKLFYKLDQDGIHKLSLEEFRALEK